MLSLDDADRVHDHTTFGFRRGCLACAQVEADLARARRTYADGSPRPTPVTQNPAESRHP